MFFVIFDRLGRLLSALPSGFRARVIFILFSWTFLSGFYLGWLAAPLIHLLPARFCGFVFSRDANPGRGDWCRSRGGWGYCLVLVCGFRAVVSQ